MGKRGFDSNLSHPQIARLAWEGGLPYLVPEAVDYMEQSVCRTSHVFEWGAGGSTIWFAKRVADVTSVEHQRAWYDKVVGRLKADGIENVVLRFIPQQPYEPYVGAISDYPPGYFSLVLVDGRERVRCMRSAMTKIEPGGLLVLDNSERLRYAEGIELLVGWERLDFSDRWTTTVFVKPDG